MSAAGSSSHCLGAMNDHCSEGVGIALFVEDTTYYNNILLTHSYYLPHTITHIHTYILEKTGLEYKRHHLS
jgi:hypothetical protein